jgi:hypothetical protein
MRRALRLLRLSGAASRLYDLLEQGRADWQTARDRMTTKYLSASWWDAVLHAARDLALGMPVPDEVKKGLTMKNWKTTLSGVAAILAVVSKIIATGQIDWQTDGPAVLAGIGLITAKDASN